MVGTLRLKSSVTLQPMSEHLVWGRLPPGPVLSAGSTVVIEPSTSRCVHRNVLVGRVVSPLWGDGWLPVKVNNPTNSEIMLRINEKVADVYPCVALEDLAHNTDMMVSQNSGAIGSNESCGSLKTKSSTSAASSVSDKRLHDLGLSNLDVRDCEVSSFWKDKLVDLVEKYESVFSRHSLDCGETKGFCHRIRITDDRPFRLPYRRPSPAHYLKLKETLDEMEKEIIKKSSSEFASPLVLVWKKNGELRLCTDFKWLNARTVKDAHPLSHHADVLAALGGYAYFSTMDLTSGYLYYQHFIENCSSVAKPLFQLLTGQRKPRMGRGMKRLKGSHTLSSTDWTDDCKAALENLKTALVSQVLLAHPDFSKPFLLSVDASTSGLGAV